MKKILIFFFCIFSFSAIAMEKSTTFNKDIFTKAQSEGKIVVVSSWIKYCSSCASQMKILQNAEKDFKNIQYLAFDVKNKEISDSALLEFQFITFEPAHQFLKSRDFENYTFFFL